jgi:hypothetical protein
MPVVANERGQARRLLILGNAWCRAAGGTRHCNGTFLGLVKPLLLELLAASRSTL